jgi:hypothetical protein
MVGSVPAVPACISWGMSTAAQVEQLRATARRLHSVVGLIGDSRGLTVYNLAGSDTWIGPTPQACSDALLEIRGKLLADQQTLTDAARRLERRADLLEQQPPARLAS